MLAEEVVGVCCVQICGDKQARVCVMKTGRNPIVRHLTRTRRVPFAWLHEQYQRVDFCFMYVSSDDMVAGIFTKSICHPQKWASARKSVNVFDGLDELEVAVRRRMGISRERSGYGLCRLRP